MDRGVGRCGRGHPAPAVFAIGGAIVSAHRARVAPWPPATDRGPAISMIDFLPALGKSFAWLDPDGGETRRVSRTKDIVGLLTFSINVPLDGCVDHQEGIADDETHAF